MGESLIEAKVILDSISPSKVRLTTLEVKFPRFILAEFNTHRVFSRNSASSRARPIEKVLEEVKNYPFIPSYWGKNQKGMQAREELDSNSAASAEIWWLQGRDYALNVAKGLLKLDVHKQLANRVLEPYMYHTVVVTATEWNNFLALRDSTESQPEMFETARAMREALDNSKPTQLAPGQWHLPYLQEVDRNLVKELFELNSSPHTAWNFYYRKISVARCARVSYLTHDKKRDIDADLKLHDRLLESGHMSPFEHVATPMHPELGGKQMWSGNFRGWKQYRKTILHEDDYSKKLDSEVTNGL